MVQNCHFSARPKSGGAAEYMNNARATVLEAVLRLGLWKLRYYLCKLQVTATEIGSKECRPPFTKGRIMRQLPGTEPGSILPTMFAEKLQHPAYLIGKHLRCLNFAICP